MKRVLVLEDKKDIFLEIEKLLGGYEVFPSSSKKTIESEYQNDYNFLKDEFFNYKSTKQKPTDEEVDKREEFFENILNKYSSNKSYDYFIIDIQLKTAISDNLGEDFIKYIEKKELNHNSKTIILSKDSLPPPMNIDDEIFEERYKFINKGNDWNTELLEYLNLKTHPSSKGSKTKSNKKKEYFIDKVIKGFFAFLLLSSILFSSWNIITKDFGIIIPFLTKTEKISETIHINTEIKNDTLKSQNSINKPLSNGTISDKSQKSNTKEDSKELNILKFAEHIFVYLIPIFIIFGFYSYYLFDFRRVLLKLPPSTEDSTSAKESIKTTKILFLSSIMSYIIIKIIEKIFFDEVYNIALLSAYGILLFLLMSYLILSHIGEHKGNNHS